MNWLSIAARNVLRHGTRVISPLAIIIVGLTGLLVGGGFMLSTYDALQEIAIRGEGHVIIRSDVANPTFGGVSQRLNLAHWEALRERLLSDARVERVLPRARFEGVIRHGAKNHAAIFQGTGVDPAEEFRVHGPFLRITLGDVLDPWLGDNALPDVVLGEELARTLDAAVGDTLTLETHRVDGVWVSQDVQVAGMYRTGTPEIDNFTLMANVHAVAALLGTPRITQLSVYLEQREDTEVLRHELQASEREVIVEGWKDRAELYLKVKSLYDRLFLVAGVIIIVVVFLAIANTIALAIAQRREEIATLSALGTTPREIRRNFVLEGTLIGAVGVIGGMLLAWAAANGINAADLWMPPPPGKTEGYPLFLYISWPFYGMVSAVVFASVVLAAWLAAFYNARANIAQALKGG